MSLLSTIGGGSVRGFGLTRRFRVIMQGYMAGGYNPSTGRTTQITKMSQLTETFSAIGATLSGGRNQMAPLSNSGTAGYVTGGSVTGSPTGTDVIDKLSQTTETVSTLSAVLTTKRYNHAGISNEGTAGYSVAGLTDDGSTYGGINGIDKIAFSNDTKSTIGATFAATDGYQGVHGVQNKGSAGYTIVRETTNAWKLNYSNETGSTLSGLRSNSGYYGSGSSNEGVAGYIAGGFDIPGGLTYPDNTDKITFSNDTRTTINNTLTSNGVGSRSGSYYSGASFGMKGIAGYNCGGYREAYIDALDKLAFPTDTPTLLGSGKLVAARSGAVGFANQGAI